MRKRIHPPPWTHPHWTCETMVEATRAWAISHGHPPQTHDFATDPALPPVASLHRRGFTVRSLRQAADLDPQTRWEHRHTDESPL